MLKQAFHEISNLMHDYLLRLPRPKVSTLMVNFLLVVYKGHCHSHLLSRSLVLNVADT